MGPPPRKRVGPLTRYSGPAARRARFQAAPAASAVSTPSTPATARTVLAPAAVAASPASAIPAPWLVVNAVAASP